MTCGEKVRNARKKAGLSQTELAQRLKINPSNISQIENNMRERVSFETLYKISKALDVDVLDLVSFDDENSIFLRYKYYEALENSVEQQDGLIADLEDAVKKMSESVYGQSSDLLPSLIYNFYLLDDKWKEIAVERVAELVEIQRYRDIISENEKNIESYSEEDSNE